MQGNDIAIKIDNISKYYRIGLKEEMNENFVGSVFNFLKRPLANFRKYRALYNFDEINALDASSMVDAADLFVALRNLSFEVKKGEVIGIIGKNGAGKSTLLKILSRITFPTAGKVEIRGRSSSLLEVGTGFHPELTGRENVYLNGTVLGMTKKEVDRKFDSIVDFSGISKFIDTPVKRYSSGMRVRLAFSVAAHLEPEILIIDEVLAVGDVEFQAKCIGKMNSIAHDGRTVFFVSHNMGAVLELCQRVLWLEAGCIKRDGLARDVITEYLSHGGEATGEWIGPSDKGRNSTLAYLTKAQIVSKKEKDCVFHFTEAMRVEISYRVLSNIRTFFCYVLLRDTFGNILWASQDAHHRHDQVGQVRDLGIYTSTCIFPEGLLPPGQYFVTIGIHGGGGAEVLHEELVDAMSFRISEVGYPFNSGPKRGLFSPDLSWRIERELNE